MKYEFLVGIRYLFSRKGDFLVSIITFISIIGVALGVMGPIVVLSVVTGFEHDFRDKILGNSSHIIIVKWGSRHFSEYDEIIEQVNKIDEVVGASPFIYGEVLIQGKGDRTSGVLVYGIDPDRIESVTSLSRDMVYGTVGDLDKDTQFPPIILGSELADHSLFVLPEDPVDLISPTGEVSPLGMGPKIRRFEVVGLFKSGLYQYDARSAYLTLSQAQRFFGYGDKVSGVQIGIKDPSDALKVSRKLQNLLGESYLVRTWIELNRDLFSAFKLEKTVFFIVMTMIILIAAFNIIGTLILVVTEKNREIAVLKALGATRRGIVRIFVCTGLIIGSIGTALGLILGFAVIILLRDVIKFPLNAEVYQIEKLPVYIDINNFWIVAIAGLLISFLATLYPSLKAAKSSPVEGLRYE